MPSLSPAFRRLASSNLAAQFSEQIALAAAPLAAVLALGADAAQTGYLQTAQTLPFLLLSLPAGVLADRMQRRLLMSAAECARAVSLLCLLALLWSGQLTLPLLAALGFLGAVGTVAYNVAAPALVPRLVAPAELAGANRWLELARSAASRPVRPPAARWSARSARPPPTRWRPRCRCWPPCCWRDCRPTRPPRRRRAATSDANCPTAPPSCCAIRCCGPCWSPPCSSMWPGSCCRPCTWSMPSATWSWTPPAWA